MNFSSMQADQSSSRQRPLVSNSPKHFSTILHVDEVDDYSPTEAEIAEYAKSIGIDPVKEPQLLNIAREGLLTLLPQGWSVFQDDKNGIFFFNQQTGESTWDHPLDTVFRKRAVSERQKKSDLVAENSQVPSKSVVSSSFSNETQINPPKMNNPIASTTERRQSHECEEVKKVLTELPLTPDKKSIDVSASDYVPLPSPRRRYTPCSSASKEDFKVPQTKSKVKTNSVLLMERDLDKTALLRAERRLSELHSHVRGLQIASEHARSCDFASHDFLTPGDRWFHRKSSQSRVNSHSTEHLSFPRLQTSPSARTERQNTQILSENRSSNVPASLTHQALVQNDTFDDGIGDAENRPPSITSSSTADGDQLNEKFSRALQLSDDRNALRKIFQDGQGASKLYGLYSPPESPVGITSDGHDTSCNSCEHNSLVRHDSEQATVRSIGSVSSPMPYTFDANAGLQYLLEEKERVKKKMTYFKLTYKAYKMRLARLDSSITDMYSVTPCIPSHNHSETQLNKLCCLSGTRSSKPTSTVSGASGRNASIPSPTVTNHHREASVPASTGIPHVLRRVSAAPLSRRSHEHSGTLATSGASASVTVGSDCKRRLRDSSTSFRHGPTEA